jgi:Holliday junction resolvase RusA-like endonuclease
MEPIGDSWFALSMTFWVSRRWTIKDRLNLYKAVEDAMQRAGIIENDNRNKSEIRGYTTEKYLSELDITEVVLETVKIAD